MNIQWKIVMGNDYFPCFKFCKLQTFRRDRSCAGPQVMFDIFLRGWDIVCGPAQDRPLRSADLAGKELSAFGTW